MRAITNMDMTLSERVMRANASYYGIASVPGLPHFANFLVFMSTHLVGAAATYLVMRIICTPSSLVS